MRRRSISLTVKQSRFDASVAQTPQASLVSRKRTSESLSEPMHVVDISGSELFLKSCPDSGSLCLHCLELHRHTALKHVGRIPETVPGMAGENWGNMPTDSRPDFEFGIGTDRGTAVAVVAHKIRGKPRNAANHPTFQLTTTLAAELLPTLNRLISCFSAGTVTPHSSLRRCTEGFRKGQREIRIVGFRGPGPGRRCQGVQAHLLIRKIQGIPVP